MSSTDSDNHTSLYIILIVVFVVAFILVYYVNEQLKQKYLQKWEDMKQESIKENTIWVENFKTLTDCTEMTLQLTEKRFYDNSFKEHAWNHYRSLC